VHTVPQAPQLFGSLVGSTQAPPHRISPGGHVVALLVLHAPLEQLWPVPQARPQALQLAGSLLRSVHIPVQHAWLPGQFPPAPQVQLPKTQLSPPGQTFPQAPQLLGDSIKSTHMPLQQVFRQHWLPQSWPPPRHAQTPAAQICGPGQTFPQAPQLF
jgi:hypothetical protein